MLPSSFSIVVLNLLLASKCYAANPAEVEYYERLIEEGIAQSESYVLPTDAREYEGNCNSRIKSFGSYDVIIVGAGSTGTVIAARLSEVCSLRVLLLEAGTYGNEFTEIPAMYVYNLQSKYNWGHETTPQRTSCLGLKDRKCKYPRGKGVGGTSLVNTVVYSRGNREDYNEWAAEGNPGWSYDDVLPYFKKSERTTINNADPGYHGKTGPLNIEYYKNYTPQFYTFLEGNAELGLDEVDYNGRSQLGASGMQQMTLNGRLESGDSVFLRPASKRRNLKVSTYSYVTKILTRNTGGVPEAYGVEFMLNGTRYRAWANKEVIVSAGAIASPHLLMLSGIGPRRHLESVGIPVVRDLAVGRGLSDHPMYIGFSYFTNVSFANLTFRESVASYLDGNGPLTRAANLEGVAFYRSKRSDTKQPDVEYMYVPSTGIPGAADALFGLTGENLNVVWGNINQSSTVLVAVILLRPKSRGVVELKSRDPFQYPLIDSRLLADKRDVETMYEGVQYALRLLNTDAFKRINATLNRIEHPDCASHKTLSKDYWVCLFKRFVTSVFHPTSTCKMGPEPAAGAVVDDRLRVYGVKRLRVADSSIFPITTGLPIGVSYMVGERFSDIFKQDYGLL